MATTQIADRWHRRTPANEGDTPCRKCGTTSYPYASASHGTELRWAVRWRESDGTQRKKLFKTKPEAQKHAAKVKSSLDGGSYVKPSAQATTFREVAAKWQRAAGLSQSPGTRAAMERRLRLHLNPAFGDTPIGSIRRSHVQDWINDRAGKLAASTLIGNYGTLASIFAWATGEYIAVSPCASRGRADRIRLPVPPPKEVVPLGNAQVGALLEAARAEGEGYWLVVLLAAASGLRQGELFGLEAACVRDGEIVVRQQLLLTEEEGGGRLCIAPPKTASSRRGLPVPRPVTDAVRAHVKGHPVKPRLMLDTANGEPREREVTLIFTSRTGEPMRRASWARIWHKIIARANKTLAAQDEELIPAGTTLHTLRHTYASLLIRERESVKVVQKRLGHKNSAITLDVYGHLWPDSAATTRAAVERSLAGLMGRGTSRGTIPRESSEASGN
ncbi:site-specific integrase [Streptomyces sp. AM 3-1-1]|uniref:tyrosine-type recombinase/integrase n=1 Tax=Streptomyces sp. AM 3-1-1 TaxID=3028711 RepID=UPI0023B8FBDB|nr:site-specific integrase [Streptomyces sp. AM 3-1-1]WEH30118.1 site-specific integrase [Streptomyces sp. AM 3-1-1]